MSLIIALSGSRKAVIGGDRRSISFLGSCRELEEELYSGRIRNDFDLKVRAKELRARLQISDDKIKVWSMDGVLIGEVTEISAKLQQRRRIYLAPGANLIVDINNGEAKIDSIGKVGCIILGNRFVQKMAGEEIQSACRVDEKLIRKILTEMAERTASVSKGNLVLNSERLYTNPLETLLAAMKKDCHKNGWMLCDPQ